jgi:cell division inhibitor SulA
VLPREGWCAGVTELLLDQPLNHELSLLLPALCSLQQRGHWAALVNPPAIPYAPGLQYQGVDLGRLVVIPKQSADDAAWACEQLLQGQSCALVVAWFQPKNDQLLRRLQLLAKAQNSLLFLCRPLTALRQSSVAQARIELRPQRAGLDLLIHKLQGEIRRPELNLSWTQSAQEAPSYGA